MRVVVVGSIAVDEVVRLRGPLQPGTHAAAEWCGERVGGGAANSAMALARAGLDVALVSAAGADAQGERLLAPLRALGIDLTWVARPATSTRSLLLIDPEGERTILNLHRASVPLPAALADDPAPVCYLRSADPALVEPMRRRIAQGRCVVVHMPPLDMQMVPAQVVVGSAADLDAATLAAPYDAVRACLGAGLEWVVITRGPAGASAYSATQHLHQVAPRVVAVDTTGAGDVFAAGLCAALAAGRPMPAALAQAVAWGSASVQYPGTLPPSGFPHTP